MQPLVFERDDFGCLIPVGRTPRNDGRIRIHHEGRTEYLYRAVYGWLHRPLKDGDALDHLCRNSSCCEPSHLEVVPQRVNARRAFGSIDDSGVCRIHGFGEMTTHRNKAVVGGRAVRCKACLREWKRFRRAQTATATNN